MPTQIEIEPFEAQFSIYYDDDKLKKNLDNNKQGQPVLSLLKEPQLLGYFYTKKGGHSPIYKIGFKDNQPVYRVSESCAKNAQNNNFGELIICEPALFPTLLILTCGCGQMDVMIRQPVSSNSYLLIETDDDDDNSNN